MYFCCWKKLTFVCVLCKGKNNVCFLKFCLYFTLIQTFCSETVQTHYSDIWYVQQCTIPLMYNNTIQYNTMQYYTMYNNSIQYTIQYNTMQYNTQYNTMQYNTIYNTQYNTIQYNTNVYCIKYTYTALQANKHIYNLWKHDFQRNIINIFQMN